MKKIIATVLAMVMALALCTTAFAAVPTWTTANGGVNSVSVYAMSNQKVANNVMTYHAAKAPVYKTDGTIDTYGQIAYYTFNTAIDMNGDGTAEYATTDMFVMSTTYDKDASFAVKAADDSAVGTQTSPEALYFMTKVTAVQYIVTGEKFTAWGDLCGQYKKPSNADTVTYAKYTYAGNEKVQALLKNATDTNPAKNVLIDGIVLELADVVEKTPHNWVASAWDKDSKATAYKCSVCGTVGTVVASPYDPATRGHQVEKLGEGVYVYFDYTPGTTTNNGSASSPKTFDAGIAMYVGMALTSVAGSAVVIGKKKEF